MPHFLLAAPSQQQRGQRVIWYHPDRRLLYVAIGRPGVIDVINVAEMAIVQTLPTEEGAHTTAFDRRRNRLYVFLPRSCRAAEYEEQGP